MINSFSGEYAFLSNFHSSKVCYAGLYPTAEHAYQATKTLDVVERMAIAKLPTAGQAKRAGRKVTLRPDWEEIKLAVMEEILMAKFTSPLMAQLLIETGDQELIEGNDWGDTFWGVCNGVGQNHLGRLLMKVRSHYAAEQKMGCLDGSVVIDTAMNHLSTDKDSEIFFTSDNHFGHRKIICYENRPFSSVEQMNFEMVRRWNRKVKEQDEVYIMGDFAFTNPVPILKKLNGKKYLVMGNHDRHILRYEGAAQQFEWIKDYYRLKVGDLQIILFHYPIMVWDMQQYGSIHLHGHVHSCPQLRHPHYQQLQNSYNVGADVNNYEPVSLGTILQRLKITQDTSMGA